jgi:hypothetical protein
VLRHDRDYHQRYLWHSFFAWEREACRATTEVRDFQPGEDYGDLVAATDDDKPPAVKQEALLPEDYDEDVAVARAFVKSNAEEDVKWSWEAGFDNIIRLSALGAEYHALFPPPPLLPPHTPPQVKWLEKMAPLPPQQAPLAYPTWPQHGATAGATGLPGVPCLATSGPMDAAPARRSYLGR